MILEYINSYLLSETPPKLILSLETLAETAALIGH